MTTITSDRINSLISSNLPEPQPGMGEMRVLNTTKKIEVLCGECRMKQGEMDAAGKRRNWIDVAAMIIGLAVFITALILGLSGILSPLAAIPIGFLGAFTYSAGGTDLRSRAYDVKNPYERAAIALEVQGENKFLQFAETQKISLNLENILEARKLHGEYSWDKQAAAQRREQEDRNQQVFQCRIDKLRNASL
ncbi:MAG: hypothetical protein V4487_04380 [Chlamydiota bacterium]